MNENTPLTSMTSTSFFAVGCSSCACEVKLLIPAVASAIVNILGLNIDMMCFPLPNFILLTFSELLVIEAKPFVSYFVVRMNINARLILLTTLCIRIQVSAKPTTLTNNSQR